MGLKEQLEAEIAMLEGRLGYRSGGRVQRFAGGGDGDFPEDNPAMTGGYGGTDGGGDGDFPEDNPALTGGYTLPENQPDVVDLGPGSGDTGIGTGGHEDEGAGGFGDGDVLTDDQGNLIIDEGQTISVETATAGMSDDQKNGFLDALSQGWDAVTAFFADPKNSNLLRGAAGLWFAERNRRSNKENSEANRQDTRNSQEQRAREFLVNQQDEVHTEYTTYMDRAESRNRAEMAQRIAMGVPRHIAEADFNESMRQAEQTAMNRASSRMGYIQASMKGAPYAGGVMDASIAFGATGPQPGGTTTQPTGGLNQVTGPSTGGTDPTVGEGTVGVPGTQGGADPTVGEGTVGVPGTQGGLNQAGTQVGGAGQNAGAAGLQPETEVRPPYDMYSTGRANEFQAARGGRVPARGGLSQVSQQPRYFAGGTKGQDDRIPALLSDGEYVMDAETVAALGDGNSKAGAAELDRMRQRIRQHKRSGSIKKIPPKSKGALNYLKGGR